MKSNKEIDSEVVIFDNTNRKTKTKNISGNQREAGRGGFGATGPIFLLLFIRDVLKPYVLKDPYEKQ